MPFSTLIFDLSEVLIAGLHGIEKVLAPRLQVGSELILPALGGHLLHQLCCGQITEDVYLSKTLEQQGWDIPQAEMKALIRENFHQHIPGMKELLFTLSNRYQLVLLSDHALEWVEYIHQIHPFLDVFTHQFFSYEIKQTKREHSAFLHVLTAIQREPDQCFFIDDNSLNVSVAQNVGIRGIQFFSSEQLSQELETKF